MGCLRVMVFVVSRTALLGRGMVRVATRVTARVLVEVMVIAMVARERMMVLNHGEGTVVMLEVMVNVMVGVEVMVCESVL